MNLLIIPAMVIMCVFSFIMGYLVCVNKITQIMKELGESIKLTDLQNADDGTRAFAMGKLKSMLDILERINPSLKKKKLEPGNVRAGRR